jgi:dynein heavy chain
MLLVLQALFRPMAMMIPDYQLVAEVMLLSEGFDHAHTLSSKMVHLYKLASEQLSQQVSTWVKTVAMALNDLLA